MASITKRGNGYAVRWRDPDGSERRRQVPNKRTANQLKREIEERLSLGDRGVPDRLSPRTVFRRALKDFILDQKVSLRPGTVERYARNLDLFVRWLVRRFGDLDRTRPEVLTKRLLRDFYESLATSGRHGRARKDSTRRKVVEVVQLFWSWAWIDDEYEPYFPPPRRLKMHREPGRQAVAPTWAEMDACIAACGGWQQKLAIVLRFTGLRVQQAMQLRWDDVDFLRGTLRVRGELGKSRQERRGRTIPVSQHFLNDLRTWGAGEGFLIESRRRGRRERQARPRDMARAWLRAGVRPEVWQGQPHHAFRKGFVTELIAEGANREAVEYLVGHSQGLRAVYTDPRALGQEDAVALIPARNPSKEPVARLRFRNAG